LNNLFKKTGKAIREGGVKTLFIRTNGYIKEKVFHIPPITPEDVERKRLELEKQAELDAIRRYEEEQQRQREEEEKLLSMKPALVDVLFINGCDESVPHPARYRVTHQREQLTAFGITSEEVYYLNLKESHVKFAQTFIFFRCPYTDTIGEFIETAKKLNKTVLFDIDDLVVDTKYTDQIKYVQNLSEDEKKLYDDGVIRMGKTLQLCEGAITTTKRLATELANYVPEVFINRNTASEKMYQLSEDVNKERRDTEIRLGYFSGSITHNDDFDMIKPCLIRLLKKYENLRLYVVGELSLPEELKELESQIVVSPYMDWQQLPQLIADVDINLAPLEEGIFNEAKSENKWVEAALVKVPTVASNVGAFNEMIESGETGILCKTVEDWEEALEKLINSKEERDRLATNAKTYVKKHCLTIYTGKRLADYIRAKRKPSMAMCFPSTEISGGLMVALKHASIMQDIGYNVTIIADNPSKSWMESDEHLFPVISNGDHPVYAYFDKAVATMWTTTPFIETHPKIKDRYYLVQGYEVDFYKPDIILRLQASQTYSLERDIQYRTISKWCQNWLKEDYDKDAMYAPNGIELSRFTPVTRDYSGKIRILIEGDCAVDYKRVDESFRITEKLDRDKYEVWYMSYNEKPKDWYKFDKFLHRVPYDKVGEVYQNCHILLKSSELESFAYPPLEMMATGGIVVVAPNGGNREYIRDGVNCLTYDHDEDMAASLIEKVSNDEELRETLSKGGLETARSRDWSNIEADIRKLYGES